MSGKILLTYASKYGSTQEVAGTIMATLRDGGPEVDLLPLRKVGSLEGYHLIVVGAPLYFGAWHKEALNFLAQNEEALAKRPVAVFALGPTQPNEAEWQAAREMLEKELAKFPRLTPVGVEVFGGKYDPARLNLPDRLIASLPASPLHGMSASDVRDWDAIRAWASSLRSKLQPVLE